MNARGGDETSCGTVESLDHLLAEVHGVRQQDGVRRQMLTRQQEDCTGCREDLTGCGVCLCERHEVAAIILPFLVTRVVDSGMVWGGVVGSDLVAYSPLAFCFVTISLTAVGIELSYALLFVKQIYIFSFSV